jgi:HEAT repeat protein
MKRLILISLAVLIVGCAKDTKKEAYSAPSLIEKLSDKDPGVRYHAAKQLGHKKGSEAKDAIPHLIEALKDEDKNVRIAVAYALAEIGPDAGAAVPALKVALKDKDKKVRDGAAYALKKIEGK